MTLADFMVEGHYARHLRRLRTVCRERRDTLLAAVKRELPDLLEITCPETGLHTVGWLPHGVDDRQVSAAALEHGVEAAALSTYHMGRCARGGLLLGYGGVGPQEIEEGVRRLASALKAVRPRLTFARSRPPSSAG